MAIRTSARAVRSSSSSLAGRIGSGVERPGDAGLQLLENVNAHRHGHVGMAVDLGEERQNGDLALDDDAAAARVETVDPLHGLLPRSWLCNVVNSLPVLSHDLLQKRIAPARQIP